MGHEAIGVVLAVGRDVRTIRLGQVVIMPFAFSDGSCLFCDEGLQTACTHGGFFGGSGDFSTGALVGGAQAEALRIPQADGTLYPLSVGEDDALMPSLLTLSDVMGTGHHAAVAARVRRGGSVAVIGDGAVGLCGIIAAKRLGAEQIIIMGRHQSRIDLAREFGATDVVTERGDEGIERVRAADGRIGRSISARVRRHGSGDGHVDERCSRRGSGRQGRRAPTTSRSQALSRCSTAT